MVNLNLTLSTGDFLDAWMCLSFLGLGEESWATGHLGPFLFPRVGTGADKESTRHLSPTPDFLGHG